MKKLHMLTLALVAMAASIASAQQPFTAGKWTNVATLPPAPVAHAQLLTDGTVLIQGFFFETHPGNFYLLTPSNTGSYINGTWSSGGTLPSGYNPLYFSSAVLPGGNVIAMGGEYNNGVSVWTNKGAYYNHKTKTWSSFAAPPSWTSVGDAQSIVLPNGKYMLANCCTTDEAILTSMSPVTWTPTGTGKFDVNDEEGWTLLPNGKILTVDAYVFQYNAGGKNSEIYNPATGAWTSAGSTVKQLWDSCGGSGTASYEVGPAVLRPDGTVFATGGNGCGAGHTAIYNTATGKWTAGPDFPNTLDAGDAPAALLPDGNVLISTSPGIFENGVKFFEWDGTALNSVPGLGDSAGTTSYEGNMLCLPTGQIMFTDFSSNVHIYTPSGTYQAAWQPNITSVSATLTHGSTNNVIKGTQFNGLSQCGAYGDDNQANTNFPLVRITNNTTGHVFYAFTHTFSTMGVATGSTVVSAQFDVPAGIETGASKLVVVANGIPSPVIAVTIN